MLTRKLVENAARSIHRRFQDPPCATQPPQITQADADFVNSVLGEGVVSPTAPTLSEMASSLGTSFAQWAKAGFAMASDETIAARMAICKECEFWDQAGYGGTGRCAKCGCSTPRWMGS